MQSNICRWKDTSTNNSRPSLHVLVQYPNVCVNFVLIIFWEKKTINRIMEKRITTGWSIIRITIDSGYTDHFQCMKFPALLCYGFRLTVCFFSNLKKGSEWVPWQSHRHRDSCPWHSGLIVLSVLFADRKLRNLSGLIWATSGWLILRVSSSELQVRGGTNTEKLYIFCAHILVLSVSEDLRRHSTDNKLSNRWVITIVKLIILELLKIFVDYCKSEFL